MEAGIVGLPNVGKSTLFNALTQAGALAANYPFATIEPNVGVVPVPDPRLDVIQSFITSQKVIPASVRLVDIAGLVKGASTGEGLGNKFLSHIRNVDAVCHVVRCFSGEVTHVDGDVNPVRDIETIQTELLLSDLQTVESASQKSAKLARGGDKEAKAKLALLEQVGAVLNEEKPVRSLEIEDKEQRKLLRGFAFLTAKPVLYIANVDDSDPAGEGPLVQAVRDFAAREGADVVPVCAQLESELAELDEEDRAEMLAEVGLEEPALAKLARAAYRTLGLQSFYTAGPKEVRAWTVPVGATAPEAAGQIHTDIQRGFIRCETYSVSDLEELKSEKAIREAGRLRVEGKDYVMRDGDVCHFLHNG
ncbi:redox-regulated ATPase YchF [Alienimonas sp. DA493]|uniref:redox-regulated ATPase YchF n=1 Tax=Alienimonas sp. DA493 TaxID=3373605 RepID=UPI003754858D